MISTPMPTAAVAAPAVDKAAPSASTATDAAAAATDAEGAGSAAGFMALIGALLQGPPTPAVTVAQPVTDAAADETQAKGADAGVDLLASLGLTSAKPSTPSDSDADPASDPSMAALLAAAAGALANGTVTAAATPPAQVEDDAMAGGRRAIATEALPPTQGAPAAGNSKERLPGVDPALAGLLGAAADGEAALDAKALDLTAGTVVNGARGAGATGSDAGTPAGLNAWAAAAHRISNAQDSAPRASDSTLREGVGSPRWKDELGARVTLMAVQGQQSGSLRLSPEHLGPLEIQITVNDDKTTNVQFGAQHADTRAALQDALPRLREMFASAGLQLGDAGVSGQPPRQRPDDAPYAGSGFDTRGDGEPSPGLTSVRSITHSGLLDTYA